LSVDGTRLYYLLRRAAAPGVVELRVMDLRTQKSDRVLPDFNVVDYAVSRDEQQAAVTTRAADGSREIWVAALDRRSAPRRVVQGGDNVAFGANHTLVFRSIEGQVNFVTRIGVDGRNRVHLSDIPVINVDRTSPDGEWAIFAGRSSNEPIAVLAVPVAGGEARAICYGGCFPLWSPDAAVLYIGLGLGTPRQTLVLPLERGHAFPAFSTTATDAVTGWRTLAGARLTDRPISIPGLVESTYVVEKLEERRNLYRLALSR